MKIINDKVLGAFRCGPCEWCRRTVPTHPHHLFARGHGGGRQIDHPLNLIALCPNDHRAHHDGHEPTFAHLIAVVAAREGVLQNDIEEWVYAVRRTDKSGPCPPAPTARSGPGRPVPDDHHGGGQRAGDGDVQGVHPQPGPGGQEGMAADEADGGWVRL